MPLCRASRPTSTTLSRGNFGHCPETPSCGCLSQVCTVTDSGVELFDLWESPEAAEKFGSVMLPVAEKLGLPMTSGPPKMSKAHRYRVPGA